MRELLRARLLVKSIFVTRLTNQNIWQWHYYRTTWLYLEKSTSRLGSIYLTRLAGLVVVLHIFWNFFYCFMYSVCIICLCLLPVGGDRGLVFLCRKSIICPRMHNSMILFLWCGLADFSKVFSVRHVGAKMKWLVNYRYFLSTLLFCSLSSLFTCNSSYCCSAS